MPAHLEIIIDLPIGFPINNIISLCQPTNIVNCLSTSRVGLKTVSALVPGQFHGSNVFNRVLTTRFSPVICWVFATQERKKEFLDLILRKIVTR